MSNLYAVVIDGFVDNVILAESKEIAEQVSGNTCILIDDNTRKIKAVAIGWQYDGEHFIDSQPFPSWSLDPDTKIWKAPIPLPEDNEKIENSEITLYKWDEDTISWTQYKQPVNIFS